MVDEALREPMREPTLLVLAALADRARHGYGVMREIETMSQGRVRLRAGTLYAALERLTGEGLVRESGQEVVGGRLRRYYALTDEGAAALSDEVERVSANVLEVKRRLRARPVIA